MLLLALPHHFLISLYVILVCQVVDFIFLFKKVIQSVLFEVEIATDLVFLSINHLLVEFQILVHLLKLVNVPSLHAMTSSQFNS